MQTQTMSKTSKNGVHRDAEATTQLPVPVKRTFHPGTLALTLGLGQCVTLTHKGRQYKVGIVEYTPDQAAYILENHNDNNRNPRPATASSYARLMKSGMWLINGECVIFDDQGNLLNGQHRFMGCVESGVPFETWVVYGVDPSVWATIDRNAVRMAADELKRRGYKNATSLAAAAAHLWRHERGIEKHAYDSLRQTIEDVLSVVEGCPALENSVSHAGALRKILGPSIAGFCHYLFYQQDAEKAAEFFERLKDGQNLCKGHPVYTLRRKFTEEADTPNSRQRRGETLIRTPWYIAYMFKGWVAFRDGKQMFSLVWKGPGKEAFPSID